ncbi:MAG: hypothetical protein AABX13_01995 [Nanoarchaeota archaeon]|mgnify:CR=1 FL=1
MVSPQFLEQKPLALAEVKKTLAGIEQRDSELNFPSTRVKEYAELFVELSLAKKESLHKKLVELQLTRLKEEHLTKIIDFLPKSVNDLKIVLQAYPLSLPKKDQESIINTVNEFLK